MAADKEALAAVAVAVTVAVTVAVAVGSSSTKDFIRGRGIFLRWKRQKLKASRAGFDFS